MLNKTSSGRSQIPAEQESVDGDTLEESNTPLYPGLGKLLKTSCSLNNLLFGESGALQRNLQPKTWQSDKSQMAFILPLASPQILSPLRIELLSPQSQLQRTGIHKNAREVYIHTIHKRSSHS